MPSTPDRGSGRTRAAGPSSWPSCRPNWASPWHGVRNEPLQRPFFLGPYLRPYRGRVGLALLSLFVAAITVLAFGACLRALIDRGFAQGRSDVLNYALASLIAVAAVLAIASGARFYLVSWLGERVVGDLRRDLFAHVVRLGPAWFEVKHSGDVMSRISCRRAAHRAGDRLLGLGGAAQQR